MKRFIQLLSVAVFMAVTPMAFAQTEEGVKVDKATEFINKVDRAAHLTAEQRPQVEQLAAEYVEQINQLRSDESTFADKKKILEANYRNRLKAILTAEQYASVEKMINAKNTDTK